LGVDTAKKNTKQGKEMKSIRYAMCCCAMLSLLPGAGESDEMTAEPD
jgi:hypothetical protein